MGKITKKTTGNLKERLQKNEAAKVKKTIPEVIAEYVCDKLQREETIGSSSSHFFFYFTKEVEFGISAEEYANLKGLYTEDELEVAIQRELEKRGMTEDFQYLGDHLEHWQTRFGYGMEPMPSAFFYDIKGTKEFEDDYMKACEEFNKESEEYSQKEERQAAAPIITDELPF